MTVVKPVVTGTSVHLSSEQEVTVMTVVSWVVMVPEVVGGGVVVELELGEVVGPDGEEDVAVITRSKVWSSLF